MKHLVRHEHNCNLKPYNTFQIPSKALIAFFPECIEDFIVLLTEFENHFILGGGSNVLLSTSGINQPVIITKFLDKIIIEEDIMTAQAGAKTPVLAKRACENLLSGFEFLVPIPASVGGAVCMNASAHNQAISDAFLSAKLFDLKTKEIIEFNKEQMEFGYRTSILKSGRYTLLEADFKLAPGQVGEIKSKMEANLETRKKSQPDLKLPNAGSIFKNPENDSAGRLIDAVDLKGKKFGGAQIYKNHANFIINTGNATSQDVCELMFLAYNKVRREFGIELEPEILFVGEKTGREKEIWDKMSKK